MLLRHKQSGAIAEMLYPVSSLEDVVGPPIKRYLVVVLEAGGWHRKKDIVIWRQGSFRHGGGEQESI